VVKNLEQISADVVIVGAGGAGLRAAIAIAETNPDIEVALISKVYPMRSHTCAAEGGAAGVKRADDSLEMHFDDTVSGGDWLCNQDVVKYFVEQAPRSISWQIMMVSGTAHWWVPVLKPVPGMLTRRRPFNK
jgi:fumarate reductase flavoprotein subunit